MEQKTKPEKNYTTRKERQLHFVSIIPSLKQYCSASRRNFLTRKYCFHQEGKRCVKDQFLQPFGALVKGLISISPSKTGNLRDIEPSRDIDEIYRICMFGIDLNNIKFKLLLKADINAQIKHLQI